jgi:hypothetical protein
MVSLVRLCVLEVGFVGSVEDGIVGIVCCGMAKLLMGIDVGINRSRVCRRLVDDEEDGCRWVWRLW